MEATISFIVVYVVLLVGCAQRTKSLISFDYSSQDSCKGFYNNFAKYVNFYKFEADRIKEYLQSIIGKDENCADTFLVIYDLYCMGYGFLQKLGLLYGLCLIDNSYPITLVSSSNKIIDMFYPDVIGDAKNVLSWLEEGKIAFKNRSNGYGVFEEANLFAFMAFTP